jgi:hypothetical protein
MVKRADDDFPVGTRYIVEGRTAPDGIFHVSERYVLLPNGRRLELPVERLVNLTTPLSACVRETRRGA